MDGGVGRRRVGIGWTDEELFLAGTAVSNWRDER